MTLAEVNALDRAAFVARFGLLFEHSPWVVEQAEQLRPFADLHAGLMAPLRDASEAQRVALIRAHPELAGKATMDRGLTRASTREQASAGLDCLTPDEFARFHDMNAAYRARFGMPFVMCVRRTDKAGILAAMETRLGSTAAAETATAIAEIGEIICLRLTELP
ncbi:2-oxo-4-hydroxy-4-carboxy-5-ureidoimidazoline decarboxylase [uncultured Sphingomonas sp.]|uniref:2-oxo-4-hydroxy-4-carboxy-5-ureidoimidazoline decarboxylase n=1 Tax=uncultured Sphingomonas sp. TaxID=158754 RepID=UPI0035CC7DA6